jgi:hypothetical protein
VEGRQRLMESALNFLLVALVVFTIIAALGRKPNA